MLRIALLVCVLLASVSPSYAQSRAVGLTQEYSGSLCRDSSSARELAQALHEEGAEGFQQTLIVMIVRGDCILVPYARRQYAMTAEFVQTWWNHDRGRAIILVRARVTNAQGESTDYYSVWTTPAS